MDWAREDRPLDVAEREQGLLRDDAKWEMFLEDRDISTEDREYLKGVRERDMVRQERGDIRDDAKWEMLLEDRNISAEEREYIKGIREREQLRGDVLEGRQDQVWDMQKVGWADSKEDRANREADRELRLQDEAEARTYLGIKREDELTDRGFELFRQEKYREDAQRTGERYTIANEREKLLNVVGSAYDDVGILELEDLVREAKLSPEELERNGLDPIKYTVKPTVEELPLRLGKVRVIAPDGRSGYLSEEELLLPEFKGYIKLDDETEPAKRNKYGGYGATGSW